MTDDQMKEVVDAVSEMRDDLNHASEDRKIYQKAIGQMVDKIAALKDKMADKDDYCDCAERCPKCGKKLRPGSQVPWPGPQDMYVVEYTSSSSPLAGWSSCG